ncbi:DNA (cytosine-5)-methyltransferase CMT3-like [Pyrus communis]|uniref:DNA (cytosine-5)-methyltransferase CMT3-like n=1 Tax=Pyrus communis TaxID=23211 RepID=UPI0035C181BC
MEGEEARKQYPKRYVGKKPKMNGQNNSNDDEDIIQARRHYTKALVDGIDYDLYDDAQVFKILHRNVSSRPYYQGV